MTDVTPIERADRAVADKAAPVRRSRTVRTLGWLSEVADQPQLISVCIAIVGLGLARRDERLCQAGFRMLASELVATKMKNVVKQRIDRTRPHVVDDGGNYRMEAGDSRDSALSSFPSGHTAGAVGVARAVARSYPEYRTPAYAVATGIAAIQVPRAKHYVSDVAVGAAIGVAAEASVDLALRILSRAAVRLR